MRAIVTAVLILAAFPAAAQDADPNAAQDIERMVREGMSETLESRLHGGRTADEKHLLAQTHTNKARRLKAGDQREEAYEQAAQRYQEWINLLGTAADGGGASERVRLAAARVEFGGVILSERAADDLNSFEIYAGRRGDRRRLATLLALAGEQYDAAAEILQPIIDDLQSHEDELLETGLYEAAVMTRLDMTLNRGWAAYYLGLIEKKDEARRNELLTVAQRGFQELVDSGHTGRMWHSCHLALAMARRELGHFDDAEQSFRAALSGEVSPLVAAQARYELARCRIDAGKFDEARDSLRPLVEKDPERLEPPDQPLRYYISLAHIWDANSYLLEAHHNSRAARQSPARAALLKKAQRARETGLAKFKRLAANGGPWPGLARVYVSAAVSRKTPPDKLATLELLSVAGELMDADRYDDARRYLKAGVGRQGDSRESAGDLLFELGRCEYQLENERAAAEAFDQVASEFRSHDRAVQAATFAYGLWGRIAERSRAPEDYLRLAATLRTLLESYADHPKREEAAWLLPVALQMAGHFEDAADEFAKVPAGALKREESQYRRVMCRRRAVELAHARLTPDEYRSRRIATAAELIGYADDAGRRAATVINRGEVLQWSAEARLVAATILMDPDVGDHDGALTALAKFEESYPASTLIGRVLALRIRAYRAQHEFELAAGILTRFLDTASPAEIGATLASLATGMREEVERLLDAGDVEAARALAIDSITTFDELEKWVQADKSRAANLEFVNSGRARMYYLAGQYDSAQELLATLLGRSPNNGTYRHLQALVLTARLPDAPEPAALRQAHEAWAALLADQTLRKRAPRTYWEARYNWLALALRQGRAADVAQAITQERVWYPRLGGPPWKAKLETLLHEAKTAQGQPGIDG